MASIESQNWALDQLNIAIIRGKTCQKDFTGSFLQYCGRYSIRPAAATAEVSLGELRVPIGDITSLIDHYVSDQFLTS